APAPCWAAFSRFPDGYDHRAMITQLRFRPVSVASDFDVLDAATPVFRNKTVLEMVLSSAIPAKAQRRMSFFAEVDVEEFVIHAHEPESISDFIHAPIGIQIANEHRWPRSDEPVVNVQSSPNRRDVQRRLNSWLHPRCEKIETFGGSIDVSREKELRICSRFIREFNAPAVEAKNQDARLGLFPCQSYVSASFSAGLGDSCKTAT